MDDQEVTQYYHRGVVCHLIGQDLAIPLDVEFQRPDEGEVPAAKRLLERVFASYSRYFDAVVDRCVSCRLSPINSPFARVAEILRPCSVATVWRARLLWGMLVSPREFRPLTPSQKMPIAPLRNTRTTTPSIFRALMTRYCPHLPHVAELLTNRQSLDKSFTSGYTARVVLPHNHGVTVSPL